MPTSDWRIFEQLVAEIFFDFSHEVTLTKKTRDGGKDIIALRETGRNSTERLLIECKHWRDSIDAKPVRELLGVTVTEDESPTGVILATTSSFTPDALRIRPNPNAVAIRLTLADYSEILRWIGDYNAIGLSLGELDEYIRTNERVG